MSRTKKSRKPGSGSLGPIKDTNKKAIAPAPRKPRKKVGKPAGNRQAEAKNHQKSGVQNPANRDPRLGSKKPIDLGAAIKVEKHTKTPVTKEPKASPIAAIKVLDDNNDLMQELERIEADEQLQTILIKQEDEIALTKVEVDYFNEKMDRHQEISEELGLEHDEEDEPDNDISPRSEDELWEKLNKTDFNDL